MSPSDYIQLGPRAHTLIWRARRWLAPAPAAPETYRVPDSEDEDGQRLIVTPSTPTWRDAWAILRGRYRTTLTVGRPTTLKKADRILRETWADGFKKLNEGPFLDKLKAWRDDDR